MTISAQLPDRPHHIHNLSERPTLGAGSRRPLVDDSLATLDNRTRGRLVPERGASPGRYLAIEHQHGSQLLALQRPITHIGRGLIADVRLEDATVSRRHAIIALRGDGARVLDDRSSNGTFVNGREVTVAYLSDGDVLRFGRVVFRYVEVHPRPAGPPRPASLAARVRRGPPREGRAAVPRP